MQAVRRRAGAAGVLVLAALAVGGCTTAAGIHEEPTLSPLTTQSYSLRTLPPPVNRVPVAVYDFPDLTGQYKEREDVQTLSRAVSQGGAPILIKALQDAGERRWFSVLDRARLDDILKERQIITEMRRIYRHEEQVPASVLPPLAHAGIIIQGGITGYDTNTKTGGLGARYLGIGADTKWQQDTVTVTLRAVSTNTSEVLVSVTVHKSIASVSLQGNVFRYVALDRILEAEAGIAENEPREIALQQTIEKAVIALIIEGAELGMWRFADPLAGADLIAEYRAEKYGTALPASAMVAEPPVTPEPAKVVETKPWSPPPAPPPAASIAPPPAKPDEVLG